MMSCEENKVVCVTGASGYIASWLVKLLLQRGYTVRGTVRDPDDPKKTEHLMSLEGAKERLHLFKADLLEEGSFDKVFEGCHGVFHTASPVVLSVSDPRAELIGPAVKGTLNILASCAKVPTIKRVVVTSSMAAVFYNGTPADPDVVVDETWFSDPAFCEKNEMWYMLAKTLAEDEAWKFAKENGIDLVVINPGYVIGPLLQPSINLSTETILKLVNGSESYPNVTYRFVDVRDIATAHILGLENPSASGRYCVVGEVRYCRDAVDILRKLFPTLQFPDKCHNDKNYGSLMYQVSKEKAKALGLKFTPFEVSLKDTVESLKEKGYL